MYVEAQAEALLIKEVEKRDFFALSPYFISQL
jgi:hypothetical protein